MNDQDNPTGPPPPSSLSEKDGDALAKSSHVTHRDVKSIGDASPFDLEAALNAWGADGGAPDPKEFANLEEVVRREARRTSFKRACRRAARACPGRLRKTQDARADVLDPDRVVAIAEGLVPKVARRARSQWARGRFPSDAARNCSSTRCFGIRARRGVPVTLVLYSPFSVGTLSSGSGATARTDRSTIWTIAP